MSRLIRFNKPFQVLSQFTSSDDRATLGNFLTIPNIYPAGRLDFDSEGLLLLTDDGTLQARIADPRFKLAKSYWVQVEGEITDAALQQLSQGVTLKDGPTRPAQATRIAAPDIWPRHPPIRERKGIPTSWINLTITEGRNRQVRRMTAATGFPTLRLIRHQIGNWNLSDLPPGSYQEMQVHLPKDTTPKRRRQPHRKKGSS